MKRKRVAFLSRVSTDEQHNSIENQDTIFQQWLERNKDCVKYKVYVDEGISGTKAKNRPAFLEMVKDGLNGEFDVLVAKSYSRFARNQRESLDTIARFRTKDIRIIFLEDGLDSENDAKNFGLMAWLAEQEAQKTSDRIKMVWKSYNALGKVHVTLAPYGYDYSKEKKNFIVNTIEATQVKRIFELYLQGNGFNSIAQMLNEDNVPTKRGALKWAGATIRGVLTNEFYLGTLTQGKTRTVDATMSESIKIPKEEWNKHYNNHESIINYEVFEKVNILIETRSKKAKLSYTKEHSNSKASRNSNASLFSNLLKCGDCGSTMTIKRKKRFKYVPFYQCLEYDRLSLKCGHSSNSIKELILLEDIKEELDIMSQDNFENLKELVNSITNSRISNNENIEKEFKQIDKKIEEQIKLSNELLINYTKGIIGENQYKLHNEAIEKSLKNYLNRKDVLHEQLCEDEAESHQEKLKGGIEELLNKSLNEWTNADLKEVIERIEIYINGTIKVHWKYFNKLS